MFNLSNIALFIESFSITYDVKKSCMSIYISALPWTMSTHDRGSAIAVTPDGLRVQSREQREWHGTRCTRGVRGGKWGFEATVTDEGLCRVGWSTLDANLDLGTCR